ncbi:uncharacterized protein EMH_0033890 [Eimeria mitis]|uniref:Uncharacterized protein n=1 Tax=Eimeria mitis TaxID=44415 RepID=U6JUD0_9EIME|nr:uncharacterized protein EMH_0033890 [Eimeria mitis]CDJ27677.1 hypothetical protein EMH_0033890 [Eimeria mitis]
MAKQLLGGLIGGEAIGSNGLRGWDDLGLSPVSVNGLAAVMPFETFLNKFSALAHEVDSDVGVMKREARKRLGAGSFSILPDQLSQIDTILDRLVWGTLRAPPTPLPEQPTIEPQQPTPGPAQPTPEPEQPTAEPERPMSQPEQPAVVPEQPTPGAEQPFPGPEQPSAEPEQPAPELEEKAPVGQGPEDNLHQQDQQNDDSSASIENLLGTLLNDDLEEGDSEEEMNAALQRVELLADAVTVLLKEYEKAVEHLQDLLDDQLDAAEEIREELEEQVEEFKNQVKGEQRPKKQEAAAAAAEVARAYDEAMQGFKTSLEALLEQPPTDQPASPAVQEDLAALAARIQAAAEEKLPSLVSAH